MNSTALRMKLSKGAGRNGTTLTPAECKFLLRRLPPPPRRRGPKPDPNLKSRDAYIAELVEAYEADGYPIEAAVAQAMEIYGIARSHVYACRARWGSDRPIAKMAPEERRDFIRSVTDRNREANLQFLKDLETLERLERGGPLGPGKNS
jgi:hypothetical protein